MTMKYQGDALLGNTASGDATVPTVHAEGPLPWRDGGRSLENCKVGGFYLVWPVCGAPVAYVGSRAHARLIVTAVNHFASMKWLLEQIADHFDGTDAPLGLDAAALLRKIEDGQ